MLRAALCFIDFLDDHITVVYLPPDITWGAETTAFINYLLGMPIDRVPVYLNPFRDEIGAQIRADIFGDASPMPRFTVARTWRRT